MLTNTPCLPSQNNSCDEHGNALKAATVQGYNGHIRYANKFNCMTNEINQKPNLPPAVLTVPKNCHAFIIIIIIKHLTQRDSYLTIYVALFVRK